MPDMTGGLVVDSSSINCRCDFSLSRGIAPVFPYFPGVRKRAKKHRPHPYRRDFKKNQKNVQKFWGKKKSKNYVEQNEILHFASFNTDGHFSYAYTYNLQHETGISYIPFKNTKQVYLGLMLCVSYEFTLCYVTK